MGSTTTDHRNWTSDDDEKDTLNSWTKDFKNEEKVTKLIFNFITPAQIGTGTDANISISWGTKQIRSFSANQPGVMEAGSDHLEWVPAATTMGELRSGTAFIIGTDNTGEYPEWNGEIMLLINAEGRPGGPGPDGSWNFKAWGDKNDLIVLNSEFPKINLY